MEKLIQLFKDEKGQTEMTTTLFIILGVAGIAFVLLTVFRDRLGEVLGGTFDRFQSESDELWQ